jgi:ABC-type microcin C transport system permease subunit YejE
MGWWTIDPLTRRRWQRFKAIRRGYYALIILCAAMVLAIFAPFLAESRALLVWHQGQLYVPTFQYLEMRTFGQEPPLDWQGVDIETDYLRLQREWAQERALYAQALQTTGDSASARETLARRYPNHASWVLMPPIPWNPYQNDFWSNEILNDLQDLIGQGQWAQAESLARRDGLIELANSLQNGQVQALLNNPGLAPNGTLKELAKSGALLAIAHLGALPPGPPDATRQHYLGTDAQGRDVAARLLYGFRISIFFSLFLVLTGQLIGTAVGSLQGYLGGTFDMLSQRLIEILMAIPFLYVVIVVAALFQPGFWMLIGILALFQWIGMTFFMRTEMYREKTREYCLAAKSYGASHWRIVFRHLLPNCLTPLVTFTPFAVVGAIFTLTGLDYLGYGLPAPTPSWGELIGQALQTENRDKLWLTLAPFSVLTATLVLVVFIGESVREAFDPKPYARYE